MVEDISKDRYLHSGPQNLVRRTQGFKILQLVYTLLPQRIRRYKLQRKICGRIRVHLQAILSKRNKVMKPVKIALKVEEKMRTLQSCKRRSRGTEMDGPLRRAASTHSASGSSWETYWVLLKQLKWSWMCIFFLSAVIQIAMWANLWLKNWELCYEDIDFQNKKQGDTDQRCPKRNWQASGVS